MPIVTVRFVTIGIVTHHARALLLRHDPVEMIHGHPVGGWVTMPIVTVRFVTIGIVTHHARALLLERFADGCSGTPA